MNETNDVNEQTKNWNVSLTNEFRLLAQEVADIFKYQPPDALRNCFLVGKRIAMENPTQFIALLNDNVT